MAPQPGLEPMSCPICQKPTVATYRPFCSRRCADIDLGHWLDESYRVPSTEPEDLEEAQRVVETTPRRAH